MGKGRERKGGRRMGKGVNRKRGKTVQGSEGRGEGEKGRPAFPKVRVQITLQSTVSLFPLAASDNHVLEKV